MCRIALHFVVTGKFEVLQRFLIHGLLEEQHAIVVKKQCLVLDIIHPLEVPFAGSKRFGSLFGLSVLLTDQSLVQQSLGQSMSVIPSLIISHSYIYQ